MIKKRYASMNKFRKRAFAAALATAVASTSFNIGSLAVNAGTSARGRVIVEFEELPEDIADQTLPIGGKKSDINFPENLEVLLYSEEAESEERTDRLEKLDNEEPATVTRREDVSEAPTETDNTAEQSNNGTQDGTVTENTDNAAEPANSGSEDQNAQSTDGTVPAEPATENSDTAGADNNSAPATETDNANSSGNTETTPETPAEGGSENTDSAESAPAETQDSGSSDGESSEGGSPEGSIGKSLVSAATEGLKNTFRPVKAYAEELDREESTGDGSLDIAAGSGNSDGSGHESGEEVSGSDSGNNEESEPARGNESNTGINEDSGNSSTNDSDNSNTSNTGTETNNVSDTREEATEASTEQASETADNPSENEVIEEPTEEASESAPSKNETKEEKKESSLKRLTDGEPRTLEDVRWRLDREKSEYGSRFQAVRAGDVFYFVPNIKDFGLKSEVDLPEIRVTIVDEEESVSENSVSEDSISDNSISENSVSENSPEFDQFMIVDGVKVRVTAPEGVFPEDATLKVTKIDDAESNAKIEQAVKQDMGLSDEAEVNGVKPDGSESSENEDGENEDGSSAPAGESLKYISFDVTITDVSGNEIQPNTEYGKANVTFSQAEIVSEYIAAPGVETEGKIGSGKGSNEESEAASEIESSTTKDGGRVFILNGDESESGESDDNVSKKTLRVYHFDDELNNAEKLGSTINESDKAVAVETAHFSPISVTIGIESNPPVAEGVFGDYKIKVSEAQLRIEVDGDSPTDPAITYVEITVIPGTGGPEIEITTNGEAEDRLTLEGGRNGVTTNVKLSGAIKNNNLQINSFNDINLTFLDGFKINDGDPNLCINGSNGKIHFNNSTISGDYDAVELTGASKFDFYVGKGTSLLKSDNTVINIIDGSTLNFLEESGMESGELELRTRDVYGSQSLIFDRHGGEVAQSIVNIKSGKYVFSGNQLFNDSFIKLDISGGQVTATGILEGTPSFKNPEGLHISGGNHIIGRVLGESITPGYNASGYVNGGSINNKVPYQNTLYESTNWGGGGQRTKYLRIIKLNGAGEGKKITGLYIKDKGVLKTFTFDEQSVNYGLNDCVTDSDGKIYLWYPRRSDGSWSSTEDAGKLYSVETEDGIYVWDSDKNNVDGEDKYAVEAENENTFAPYVYITDIQPINENVLYDTNYFKDILTLYTSDGKSYSGGNVLDKNIPGVYDRLKDIEWEVIEKPAGAGNDLIADNNKYSARINMSVVGSYKIKAKIKDDTGLNRGTKEFIFTIPKFTPVKKIVQSSENIEVKYDDKIKLERLSSKEYSLQGVKLTVSPNNATAVSDSTTDYCWSWSIFDPTETSLGGGSNPTYDVDTSNLPVGNYIFMATIARGKSDTEPYTQEFKVKCRKDLTHTDITVADIDPVKYTGNPVAATVIVKDKEKQLTENTDYKLTYKDNTGSRTETATATVTITGIGDYSGSVNKTFTITPNEINDTHVRLASSIYGYTGKPITPDVTVSYNGKKLIKDTDYTVTYENNVEVGNNTAKVIVTGIGIYTGKGTKTFTIAKMPVGSITIPGLSLKYDTFQTADQLAKAVNGEKTSTEAVIAGKTADGTGDISNANLLYIVTDKFYSTANELLAKYPMGDSAWKNQQTDGNARTVSNYKNYIYAMIKETDDLYSVISTKQIVDDRTAPTNTVISDATIAGTTATVSVEGEDELSGIGNYYVLAVKKGSTAPSKEKIKQSGVKGTSSPVKITNLLTTEQYTFYAVTEDKAGNISDASAGKDGEVVKGDIQGTIKVAGKTYNSIQTKQEVDVITDKQEQISLAATGNSGVKKIEYFVSDKFYSSGSAMETGAKSATGGWAEYDDSTKPYIERNKVNYIYMRVTTNAGTDDKPDYVYFSSKGIMEDDRGEVNAVISVMGSTYSQIQTTEAIQGYTKKQEEFTITASGKIGVKKIEYYVSDKFYSTSNDIETGAKSAGSGWVKYDGKSKAVIEKNKLNYIYARVTTDAGTDTDPDYVYVSSKGIWEDEAVPTISSITASMTDTSAKVTVTAKDAESGLNNYYLMVKKHGEKTPTAAEIMKSGTGNTTGIFSVSKLTKGNTYDFYSVVTDKAGNISAIKSISALAGEMSAKIEVEDLSYDVLQGRELVEDKYYNEPKEIKITATGASKIEYFITNKFYSSTSELENAANPTSTKTSNTTQNSGTETTSTASKWSVYNDDSRPYLKKNFLNYIYAKITDASGKTIYISSHGIWEDELKPKVTSVKTTPKDKTASGVVKGKDDESGIKYYYLLVKKTTEDAPKKAEDVKGGMRSEDGKFDLSGLSPSTKYNVYAVIEDKAGNLSEIKKGTMSTKKDSTSANKAKAAAAGAGAGAGKGAGAGSGSNVDKRTAGQKEGKGSSSDSSKGSAVRDGVPFIEDASDGILIGREKTSGWDRIESEVGKAQAPAQVFVNMNGSTEVPAAALKECENRDITYYFLMNDDITWAVNGLSFTEAPKNIDFRVRTDTKNIPSKLVNEIADVYPHTNLTLEHSGEFGFTAILSLNVGENNEGMYANLYYYNEDNNSLEFIESTEVDGSGRASFDFVHASDYTVILRGDALTDKSAAALADGSDMGSIDGFGGGSSSPKNVSKNTGHLWLLIVSIISFLLCGFILFMPDKKKKRRGYAGA